MTDPRSPSLGKIASESLEKLAFMFFMSDSFREAIPLQNAIVSEVAFSGVFSGRLAVVMTETALKEMAANMLGVDPDDVELQQMNDALKESANIICGNWLPVVGGDEAVFNISAPKILSLSEAAAALTRTPPSVLEKMTADEEPCDIYFFRE